MALIRLIALACMTALAVAGCSQTRSISLTGIVLDLSGAPVAGARVYGLGEQAHSPGAASGADGRFELTVERTRSGVVLPVSGVYVDPVLVTAVAPGAVAYGAASALSTSETADGPALLILVPEEVVFNQSPCLSEAPRDAYALALSARLGDAQAWLSGFRRAGDTEGLHQLLRGDIAAAARRCELPQAAWSSAYDAVDAALDPYRDD